MAFGLSRVSFDICPICWESNTTDRQAVSSHPTRIDGKVAIIAKHTFHRECLGAWIEESPSHPCCPVCREPISVEQDVLYRDMTPLERGCSFLFHLRRHQFARLPEILQSGPIEDRFFKRIIDLAIERNSTVYVEQFFQAIEQRFPIDQTTNQHKKTVLDLMFHEVMERQNDLLIRYFYAHPLFEMNKKCQLIFVLAREHRFDLATDLAEQIVYDPTTVQFASLFRIYQAYFISIENRNINLFHSLNRFPICQVGIQDCLNMAVRRGQLEMVTTILETQKPTATQRMNAAKVAEQLGLYEIEAVINRTISILDKHMFVLCLLAQFIVIGLIAMISSFIKMN